MDCRESWLSLKFTKKCGRKASASDSLEELQTHHLTLQQCLFLGKAVVPTLCLLMYATSFHQLLAGHCNATDKRDIYKPAYVMKKKMLFTLLWGNIIHTCVGFQKYKCAPRLTRLVWLGKKIIPHKEGDWELLFRLRDLNE